jgi:hypothetical protein
MIFRSRIPQEHKICLLEDIIILRQWKLVKYD